MKDINHRQTSSSAETLTIKTIVSSCAIAVMHASLLLFLSLCVKAFILNNKICSPVKKNLLLLLSKRKIQIVFIIISITAPLFNINFGRNKFI